jgi:hypothetical protein
MRKVGSKEDEEIIQKISEQFIERGSYIKDREKKKSWYDNKQEVSK